MRRPSAWSSLLLLRSLALLLLALLRAPAAAALVTAALSEELRASNNESAALAPLAAAFCEDEVLLLFGCTGEDPKCRPGGEPKDADLDPEPTSRAKPIRLVGVE